MAPNLIVMMNTRTKVELPMACAGRLEALCVLLLSEKTFTTASSTALILMTVLN